VIDIRVHGRGGQGAMTASRLLAEAALLEGKYIHAFPSFGPERMGAPMEAFTRISAEKFYMKTQVYEPDAVLVLDPTLFDAIDVTRGLVPDGTVIANFKETPQYLREKLNVSQPIATVDATNIALETIRRPITNTIILGALVKVTDGIVTLDSLKNVVQSWFAGPIAENNIRAIERAYEEVKFSE
jgi:pyruvate ferredoxin oxidoreductase gamma subunit/2-oxoisovalerate ferredoxin oxidoreductase gamma subunit